jgi:hypothetical protein
MKKIITISLLTSSLLFATTQFNEKNLPILNIQTIKTNKKIEPSGLTFFKNDLFIASDNGRICSVNQEKCIKLEKKYDIEGLTTDGEKIYLAIEGKDDIGILEEDMSIKRISIPRKFKGKIVLKKGGDGIEAITYLYKKNNKDYFIISNQSDRINGEDSSSLIIVSVEKNNAKIEKVIEMPFTDISGLFYKNDYLFVLSDDNDLLKIYKNFKEIDSYFCPGEDQEGIYINKNNIYIAQDSGDILIITIPYDFIKKYNLDK